MGSRFRRGAPVLLVGALITLSSSCGGGGGPGGGAGDTTTTVAGATGTVETLAPKDLHVGLLQVGRVDHPTSIAMRVGDPTLFVTSQDGWVNAIGRDAKSRVVLDIRKRTSFDGEKGLVGIAFTPDGSVAYIDFVDVNHDVQVEAYRVGADGTFDAASRRTVITLRHPEAMNHFGGQLVVDAKGLLYISIGDGTMPDHRDPNAQDLTKLLGKILRIDPNPSAGATYGIPKDNPFFGSTTARGEIWSFGLRNPWRFSFDRLTGDLWIGDVGQHNWEEVDHVSAADGAGKGANFGWSAYEGSARYNRKEFASKATKPLVAYAHDENHGCVIGGYVYRGPAIPGMFGAYVFADQIGGKIEALRLSASGHIDRAEIGWVEAVSTFGEGTDGELYVASYTAGVVYRLVSA